MKLLPAVRVQLEAGFGVECVTKQKDWKTRCQTRTEEALALTNTITIQNDEDVAELRKKMLPAPALVQMKFTSADIRSQAIAVLATHTEYHLDDIVLPGSEQKDNDDEK